MLPHYQEDSSDASVDSFSDAYVDSFYRAIIKKSKEIETAHQKREGDKHNVREMMLEKLQVSGMSPIRRATKRKVMAEVRGGYPMKRNRRELYGAYSRKTQRPRTFRHKRIF